VRSILDPTRRRAWPLAALMALTACQNASAAFGSSPALAREHGDDMFTALEQRFTSVVRPASYDAARNALFAHALTPSRVIDDRSIWNATPAPNQRALIVTGHFEGGHYAFADAPEAPLPDRLGDGRHTITLTRLTRSEYGWTTNVTSDWGTVTGADLDRVLAAILASAATHPGRDLRPAYRSAFPHTALALGRLLSLDSLRATPIADGTASVTLVTTLHPDRLAPSMPAYARYLVKYVNPARFHLTLVDDAGITWFEAAQADNHVTVTLHATRDGRFAPFAGPPRPMPHRLEMRSEWFDRMSLFTIGVSDLVADFTILDDGHTHGWLIEMQREPTWHLPLAAAHLMHASIARPFQGSGTSILVSVTTDSVTGRTRFQREVRTTVLESTIMRWLGDLGGSAATEFTATSEGEENRFDAELFAALRADLGASLPVSASP